MEDQGLGTVTHHGRYVFQNVFFLINMNTNMNKNIYKYMYIKCACTYTCACTCVSLCFFVVSGTQHRGEQRTSFLKRRRIRAKRIRKDPTTAQREAYPGKTPGQSSRGRNTDSIISVGCPLATRAQRSGRASRTRLWPEYRKGRACGEVSAAGPRVPRSRLEPVRRRRSRRPGHRPKRRRNTRQTKCGLGHGR